MSKLSFLARTSLLIAFFFLIDKVLAFVRVGIISRIYTDEVGLLDVFNSANNVPDVLFALISGGALAMAFIPLMSDYLTTKGRAAAWDLFSRVANLAFLVTGSIAILVFIFAQQIVDNVIVPGFTAEQRLLVAELMRLNLVSTIIFSISGLVMASLQANQHFLLPALAPTMYNVGQIFGALIFVPRLWYSRAGVRRHPRRGVAFAGSNPGVVQIWLQMDSRARSEEHRPDRGAQTARSASAHDGRHSSDRDRRAIISHHILGRMAR